MRKHYERIVKGTDKRVKKALRVQVTDQGSPYYGGFPDGTDLFQAKFTMYRLTTMITAYCNEDSVYYQDEQVAERILLALDFVKRYQHEDGLFDLINCNFYSAPDTAFIVKRMLPCMHYLRRIERNELQEKMYSELCSIAENAVQGLYTGGGFHTPNHRWAIASNLVECADFFNRPEWAEGAKAYLIEGIDCNEDGEYAEKSAGGYNRINNDAMITLGRYLGEDDYFEHAVRNLRMMLTYIEPDGTIFTANSTRQDNGKRVYPIYYYWEYLTMGKDRNIPEFIGFANHIFEVIEENHLKTPDILIYYMNRPELIDFEYEGSYCPDTYRRVYGESGIARVRRNGYTYTLMEGKSNFLQFSNDSIDVMVKIGGCICEHRAFKPESLEETEDGFVLKQVMKGWYYLPFKEYQGTNDWWKMDHTKRDKKWGPNLTIEAWVRELEDGVEVTLKLHGIEKAPFRVEVAVLGAEKADGESFTLDELTGTRIGVKSGMVQVTNAADAIEIGPAFGNHSHMKGIFGSESPDPNCFTMYFTDYTEFEHTFTIRSLK